MNLPAVLKNESGYALILVTVICLTTLIIFGKILPQLHLGQQILALTNLNEHRGYRAAEKGINTVKLGVKYSEGASFQELIADEDTDGILKAIKKIFGTSASPIHTEYTYWDEDSGSAVPHFISSCLNIDEVEAGLLHEKGELNIAILVRRGVGKKIFHPPQGFSPADDGKDDEIYFWDGSQWVSYDKDPNNVWDKFAYYDNPNKIFYCDFDLDLTGGISDAEEKADFAFECDVSDWSVTIGNNGSFRLWGFEKNSNDIGECYPGQDNNFDNSGIPHGVGVGDCPDDSVDCIEVFIIVRSTGISVAPGPDYPGVPSSQDYLWLVNKANSHLPNPMRQVVEAGFYLEDDGGVLKIKQFYFGKASNLKAGDEP